MNIDRIPPELRQFVDIVEEFGDDVSDESRLALEHRMLTTPELLEKIRLFIDSFTTEHQRVLDQWLDEHPMSQNPEGAKFYFLGLLLGEMDLGPRPTGLVTTERELQRALDILERPETGSMRKISEVAHAMMDLIAIGVPDSRAIAKARDMLHHDLPNLRCWAHAVLAVLEGDRERHREEIVRLMAECKQADRSHPLAFCDGTRFFALSAESALSFIERSPEQLRINQFMDAVARGNVQRAAQLLEVVDVNARDHNDGCAIIYAVHEGHLEMVILLLEHGADPNGRGKHGDAAIHYAAWGWREDSGEIIRLLVKHGADLHAKNSEGKIALDIAIQEGAKSNEAVIRELMGRR